MKAMGACAAGLAAIFAVSGHLVAQRGAAAERLALVNATVVNVATGTLQDGQTIVLDAGRIASLGPARRRRAHGRSTSGTGGWCQA